jgi:hypothetical protein
MMKQLQGQKNAVSVQFTPDSILSLWNMELSFVIWPSCGEDCILVLAFSFSPFDVFVLASQYLMVLVLIFLTEVL